MKRPSIISLGEVLWDLFPDGERFGGAPANFACHASNLGSDLTLASAVGDDSLGRVAITMLKRYGIERSLVRTVSELPTGTVEVELDAAGNPTFSIHENSAWDRIEWSDELGLSINSADAIYFGTLGQRGEVSRSTIRRAVQTAKLAGIPRILDVNLRPPFFDAELICDSVRQASMLKLSNNELVPVCAAFGIDESDDPKMMRSLREIGELDMVVMTSGEKGALLVTEKDIFRQDGIPTEVKDSVGAGDAFAAAFLTGVLNDQAYEENLLNACRIAAVACNHSGAVPVSGQTTTTRRIESKK